MFSKRKKFETVSIQAMLKMIPVDKLFLLLGGKCDLV